MSKWTQGPWAVENPATDCRPGWSWISAPGHGWYGLAEVVTRMDGDTNDSPVGRANATLIAAAPDLAEALAELVEQADQMAYERLPQDYEEQGPPGFIINAYAALAKARGET